MLEGSHRHFDDFMERLQTIRCSKVSKEDLEWLAERGCARKRVACPKGGMVLWDSRLIHGNARPVKGRANPDRWRYVVFVCMTPAAWASEDDIKQKVNAYNNLQLTGHWPSMGMIIFPSKLPEGSVEDPNPLTELPEVATSELVQRLVGVIPYEEAEDNEDVMNIPKFRKVEWL